MKIFTFCHRKNVRRFLVYFLLVSGNTVFIPSFAQGVTLPETVKDYQVVVAGAGVGGTMAAIQAARMGARVALVEESGWIGGQMTGGGVSTMDDVRRNRSGIYGELIERVRQHYAITKTNINTCYWGSDTIAFEPGVGEKILYDMIREIPQAVGQGNSPGSVDVYLQCRLTEAVTQEGKVTALVAEQNLRQLRFRAWVFIDATECGDLLPLTPARYRAGNSISPNIREDANIQDITWVGVIRKDPEGSAKLRMEAPPKEYEEDLPRFQKNLSLQGKKWPKGYPVDIPSFNAYRGLPNPESPLVVDCGKPHTWERITKTGMNWANDYPGRGGYVPGLSVRYLEDRAYRKKVDARALLRTLGYLYYYQQELEQPWTVDTTQNFHHHAPVGDTRTSSLIPREYHPITRNMPPFPYVRESRRLVGMQTLTVKDVKRNKATGRGYTNFPTSIGLGEYPVDIHGSHLDQYMEHDLGESVADFPSSWIPSKGVFQVPLGCLIPEKVNGLIGAEKNISVSRLVNGATRLQPIAMLTGQAAGALATLAARYAMEPREVPPLLVQQALWEAQSRLSMYSYEDVPQEHPLWQVVQDATLYGYLPGMGKSLYALSLPLMEKEGVTMLNSALGSHLQIRNPKHFLSANDFREMFIRAGGSKETASFIEKSEKDISREMALQIVFKERVQVVSP